MSINAMARVFMYVDSKTRMAEKMVCYTPFGMTERTGGTWEPTTRDDSGIDDLQDDLVYELDWDTDFLPMDAEDDGKEHAAIALFDEENLTEDDCKNYGKIYIDPENPVNPETQRIIEEYNNTIV